MKRNFVNCFSLCVCFLVPVSCSNTPPSNTNVIKIGTQTWAVKNLNLNHFRNGDTILQAKSDEEWVNAGNASKPAWCYYNNDATLENKYGKIYNWFAINDPRELADSGWHIPSDTEWNNLMEFLGGADSAGTKIKSSNGWNEEGNGTNVTGFTGLPGGYRYNNGIFKGIGLYGSWWSKTPIDSLGAWYRYLSAREGRLNKTFSDKRDGFSVRCIKN